MAVELDFLNFVVPIVLGAFAGWGAVAMGVGRYKEKIEQLEKCCAGERISKIEGKFEVIQSYEPMTKRGSPIQLTEHGSKVLTDSGFKSLIDEHAVDIVDYVENCATDTKYDVQECSERVCEYLLERNCLPNEYHIDHNPHPDLIAKKVKAMDKYRPLINEIKDWLYENGYKVEHLVESGTVYVRDKAIPVIFTEDA